MRPEVKPHEPAAKRPPFVRRHGRRLTALFLWCGLLGGYYWYAWQHGVSPLEAVQRLVELMTSSTLGPLVYVALYAARPLVLFPASLLTLAAGFVFGPVLGTLLVILGSNISASIAQPSRALPPSTAARAGGYRRANRACASLACSTSHSRRSNAPPRRPTAAAISRTEGG